MSLDYYTSERFIHDDLLKQGQNIVNLLYSLWKKHGKIDDVFITWPSEPVKSDSGEVIEDMCGAQLPKEPGSRWKAINAFVERTKAYALLLIESQDNCLKAILESPHGTRTWTVPIRKSGDVKVLGEADVKDDSEFVGLIWRPQKGVA